jgi:hypothetical protein
VGNTLYYGLGDHLGSTSVTVAADGTKFAEMRYKAWGEVRYTYNTTPTDRTYTGQRGWPLKFCNLLRFSWEILCFANWHMPPRMIGCGLR